MEVSFSDSFKKAFHKRIKSSEIENEFWNRLEIFINDPFEVKLKTHKLSGKLKDLWSFSIEYDLRVVFYFTNDKPKRAVFVDIGTHNEVY
jgi:addiction module RelE/StbE family toxin